MKPEVRIDEAKAWHCGQLARQLRHEHLAAFDHVGLNAHRTIRSAWLEAGYARALYIDGEFSAMWGTTGTLMSPFAICWVGMTERATRVHWNTLVRLGRWVIDEMMKGRLELGTIVLETDVTALRFMAYLGFHVGHNDPRGRAAYTAKDRHDLVKFIQETSDYRVPIGAGRGIVMGYHRDDDPIGPVMGRA